MGLDRSSYYKWKNIITPQKEYQDQELSELITEYDCAYNHILGYRRMTMYINRLNKTNYCWKYIRKLMRIYVIAAITVCTEADNICKINGFRRVDSDSYQV